MSIVKAVLVVGHFVGTREISALSACANHSTVGLILLHKT